MIEIPPFSPDYIKQTRKLWSRFQDGEDISGLLRPVIYESWARCKHQDVPVMGGEGKDVPSDEMEMLTDEEEQLIQITEPIMDRIHAMTKSFSCRFVLTNSAGISLRTWTGHDTSLTGYHLREEYMGTAGIATCLKTKKGVIVRWLLFLWGAREENAQHFLFLPPSLPSPRGKAWSLRAETPKVRVVRGVFFYSGGGGFWGTFWVRCCGRPLAGASRLVIARG